MEHTFLKTKDSTSINRLIDKWAITALVSFFVAALFGTIMRFMFVIEVPFLKYKNILQAHSHVAMLGWGFMILILGLICCMQSNKSIDKYKPIYILSTIATIGMAVSFSYQGYGPISIAFSALHLITAYIFGFKYLKGLKEHNEPESKRFLKWGVIWMLISSLGIWSIGFTSATLGKHHSLFYASIQFFLHFQFNGWFTFATLGLVIDYLNKNDSLVKIPNYIFTFLQISLCLTYALSITWSTPIDLLFHLNALGVILQLFAYTLILVKLYKPLSASIQDQDKWPRRFMMLGLLSLLCKVMVQALVLVPSIAIISYTIRNYVVAFIHLIMLGSITFTLTGILVKKSILKWNSFTKTGWLILLTGFFITEFILFGQGTLIWMEKGFVPYYYLFLFLSTLLLPIGIAIVISGSIIKFKKSEN